MNILSYVNKRAIENDYGKDINVATEKGQEMSEKTASEIIKQIYEHLKRTSHLDIERQTALDMAYKALNRNDTDLIESCVEEIRRLGIGEIEVNTTTKDGYIISVKVEKYQGMPSDIVNGTCVLD